MHQAMTGNPPAERLVLVSCVRCGQLHEPPHPMVFNPVCPTCETHCVAGQPRGGGSERGCSRSAVS